MFRITYKVAREIAGAFFLNIFKTGVRLDYIENFNLYFTETASCTIL
jgi:hypothetical protein